MRNFFTTAAGTALFASAVSAACTNTDGNYYCAPVSLIQYQNFQKTGSYNRVTSMDSDSGTCGSEPFGFSGSLAPLNGEISIHHRGPMHLVKFAYYKPGSSSAKRSVHQKRHGHSAFHAHHNAEEKKRAVGDIVYATIDGQLASWTNEWSGLSTPAPAAAATSVVSAAGSAVTGAAPPAVPGLGGSHKKGSSGHSGSSKGSKKKPFEPAVSGDWVRNAYYRASTGEAEGLVFLNNFGGQESGVFDNTFGNSLSYASSDGQSGAASPQVLKDMTIPSNTEIIMMSDRPCSDGSGCGFSRPGTVAHHGFDNENAVYLFQFSMPDDGSSGFNANMPALWMLNAQIPRTLQYGKEECSCWKSGCGEFDIFEVLTSGEDKCKSTLHGAISGGDSDYFNRPTGAPIKVAVVMSNSMATIKILPDSFDFGQTLSNADVSSIGSHSTGGLVDSLGSSIFNLLGLGSG